MTLRQTLAVGAGWLYFARYTSGLVSATWQGAGWLCFARHIKEGRARKRHVAAPSLGGLAKSAFSHCGHSCCLTARTYPRIQMDAGTPAPSAKPSSAQPVSCCSLLRQPGSPSQQPWDKPKKPTESTAAESTSSFCPPRVIPWDGTQGGKALLLAQRQRESKQLFQEDLVG